MSMAAVASTKNGVKVLENMLFVDWLNVRSRIVEREERMKDKATLFR